eukprot:scaffold5495_cov376-Prasinococcus_capsulatus_cf.AAC.6
MPIEADYIPTNVPTASRKAPTQKVRISKSLKREAKRGFVEYDKQAAYCLQRYSSCNSPFALSTRHTGKLLHVHVPGGALRGAQGVDTLRAFHDASSARTEPALSSCKPWVALGWPVMPRATGTVRCIGLVRAVINTARSAFLALLAYLPSFAST